MVNVTPWFVKNTCTWLAIDSPGCSSTSGRGPQPMRHVEHVVELAAGRRAQEHQIALGERQQAGDRARRVSGVGEHHLGGDVLTDERLLGHGHGEHEAVGAVGRAEPADVDRCRQPGREAAVTPAEVLPAWPNLRVRASG